jgi:hypothetical protein
MVKAHQSTIRGVRPRSALNLSAFWALVLAGGLTACGSNDPVVTVLRIFDPTGQVIVRLEAADSGGPPNRVAIEWEEVPDVVIKDYVYAVWLRPHPQGAPVRAARFRLPRDSTLDLGIEGTELINQAAVVEVVLEPDDNASQPAPDLDFLSHLAVAGPLTLEHIQGLLAAGASGDGSAIRLAVQTQSLRAHTELASQAADQGDVAGARRSIEQALNITNVPPQDHDGDGSVENPDGDGVGLDVHARRVSEIALEAVAATDAWPAAAEHGALAATVSDTVGDRLARLVTIYNDALAAPDLLSLRAETQQALALADILLGDPTAVVAGSCGRCGALTAWHQSLLMTERTAEPQETFVISLDGPGKGADPDIRQRFATSGAPRNPDGL